MGALKNSVHYFSFTVETQKKRLQASSFPFLASATGLTQVNGGLCCILSSSSGFKNTFFKAVLRATKHMVLNK